MSGIPFGFKSFGQLEQFGTQIQAGVVKAGYEQSTILLQGSSVTGIGYKSKLPFDVGRVSDFCCGTEGVKIEKLSG